LFKYLSVYPPKTKGFGSTIPVASNAQELARSKNRRIELVILK
jgi:flagellar motor protein MotB